MRASVVDLAAQRRNRHNLLAMQFRVQLDVFAGPLDLLHYLVRKHEVDIQDIPISRVAEQYLEVLAVLEQIDVDAVGDFLDVASRLIEMKSQAVLPAADDQEQAEESSAEDHRDDLVQQLLEYKRYKQAASLLDERGREWQQRFARKTPDSGVAVAPESSRSVGRIEIWDLVSAFSRVLQNRAQVKPAKIRYDDTPIEVYIERIRSRVEREGRLRFVDLFESGMHRSQLVGLLLAVLELIRDGRIRADQQELFGEIWLTQAPRVAAAT